MKIVIGSRGSKLALIQSEEVRQALLDYDSSFDIEIKVIHTKGDAILDKPLNKIGDKGLFTKEIESQLLSGEIDLAVHSLKDLPSDLPEGLVLADTIKASSSKDCIIFNKGYHSIDELPPHALIGTGSLRRKYSLLNYRSDLTIVNIRGNIQTRIDKMYKEDLDAIILAKAGLERCHLDIGEPLDYSIMIPACGQGILGIEVREDSRMIDLIHKISDPISTRRMHLERAFLKSIGGSCHQPIGAHVEIYGDDIEFYGLYGNEEKIVSIHKVISDHYEEEIIKIADQLKEEVENG